MLVWTQENILEAGVAGDLFLAWTGLKFPYFVFILCLFCVYFANFPYFFVSEKVCHKNSNTTLILLHG